MVTASVMKDLTSVAKLSIFDVYDVLLISLKYALVLNFGSLNTATRK